MAYDPELDKNIDELPVATTLTGAELVEVIQGGVNKQTTAQYIANLVAGGDGITWAGTVGYLPVASSDDGGGNITGMVNSPLRVGGYYTIDLYGEITSSAGSHSAFTFLAKNGTGQVAGMGVYNTSDTANAGVAYLNSFDSTGLNGTQLVSARQTIEMQYRSSVGGMLSNVTVGLDTYITNISGEFYLFNNSSIPSGSAGILAIDSSNRVYSTAMPASGTVESISIASANGFGGSSDGDPVNPVLSITTSVTGILKGNGTSVSAASATDITAYILTGLSITGGSIASTDSIIQAFGKLQNQINGVLGGAIYQGVWNATTNSPALASGVGTKGYYYVVNVAGSTNLDGTTDWKVGDWAIFNGTTWDKVDNTDAVSSVNGAAGAVVITVTGTSNRISVSGGGGTAPTVDIDANYVGQTSITTLGTIATGTWNGSAISTTYTDAKIKTVTGTANRISIGGTTTDPTFDISTAYVGQATITTLGTVATGVWNGTIITGQYGGTGVANTGFTMTYAGNVAFSGAFNTTLAAQASVTTTLPAVATTLAGKTGTMAASYIGYWNDANQLTGSTNFTYDGTSVVHTGSVAGALFSITNSTSSAAAKGLLITMSANGHNAAQGILVLKSTTSGGSNVLTMLDFQQNGQNATTTQEILMTYNLRDNSTGRSAGAIAFKYSDVGSGTQKTGWTFRNLVGGTTLTDSAQILGQDFKLLVAGGGIYLKEGSNATMGVATLVAGTVTVSTTKVTANSRIILTRQTTAGTLGSSVDVTARVAGTSFTITSNGSTLDTSTVAWLIIEPS